MEVGSQEMEVGITGIEEDELVDNRNGVGELLVLDFELNEGSKGVNIVRVGGKMLLQDLFVGGEGFGLSCRRRLNSGGKGGKGVAREKDRGGSGEGEDGGFE